MKKTILFFVIFFSSTTFAAPGDPPHNFPGNYNIFPNQDPADYWFVLNHAPNPTFLAVLFWPLAATLTCDQASMSISLRSPSTGAIIHSVSGQRAGGMSVPVFSAQYYLNIPAGATAGQTYEAWGTTMLIWWIPALGGPIPCVPFTDVYHQVEILGVLGGS